MQLRYIGPVVTILPMLGACATSNLAWDSGPKVYTPPPQSTLDVAGLGVDAPVDILSPVAPFTAARTITNPSRTTVSAGYTITETIIRWVFVAAGGSAGWVAGDPATHTVFTQNVAGPALATGASAPVTFGPVTAAAPLPCGLYRQTITIDPAGAVTETSKADNVTQHFFFVPSTQQFNISVAPIPPGGPLEPAIFHAPAAPTPTHTFAITTATTTPPPSPQWIFAHFSFVATEGSMADTDPAPAAPGGPAPQTITMRVTPRTHNLSPLGFAPTVTGKITVISQDGCVIKQETARVLVEHTTD